MRVSVDNTPPNDDFSEKFYFCGSIIKGSIMLGLDYLEELKESAKLPIELEELMEELMEEDAPSLNLYVIRLRVIRVTMFALAHEEQFLKKVINAMESSGNSGELLPYYTERLPSKELFGCLRLLNLECLWIVLERLKSCQIGLVEKLVDAVISNSYEDYLTILDENEINTEPITPINKLFYVKIRIDKLLNSCFSEIQSIVDLYGKNDDQFNRRYKSILLQFFSELKNILGDIDDPDTDSDGVLENMERNIYHCNYTEIINDDETSVSEKIMMPVINEIEKHYPTIKEKGLTIEDLMNYFYMDLLRDYYEGINDCPSLSTYAKLVIEDILKSETFKPIWDRYEAFNKDMYDDLAVRMDEFCERFGLVEEEDEESGLMTGSDEGQVIDCTNKRQQDVSDSEIQGFKDSKPDLKKNTNNTKRWRLQNYLNREVGLDEKTKLPYCKGFKKSIAEAGSAGDRALAKFIQGIAELGYIDDDRVTKKSFAYALTGRGGFREMVIKKVTWHHKKEDTREIPESVRVLLFISSNLFDPELTRGKTYSQIFEVLDAETNPCIKDGKDQSASYYDSVSDNFKIFFYDCFKDTLYKKNTAK